MALLKLNHLKDKYSLNIKKIAHVGAHRGQEVKEYQDNFPEVEIYLFEPQLNLFRYLQEKFKTDKNIHLYNYALGSKKDCSSMFMSNNDGQSSSFYKPKHHLIEHPEVKFQYEEQIFEIKVFDDLGINDIDFLNIDTQGFEMEVLKGSVDTLEKSVKYLILEVNKKELYEGCPRVKDIDTFLNKYGFIRTDTHYWMDSYSWGDAFYIKKELISYKRLMFSVIKNYFYGIEFLYKFLIIIRNVLWGINNKIS